jgi:hypothetical protein
MKPWPQLLGAHPVDARGTGVLLVDAVNTRLDVGLDDPLIGAARQVVGLGDRVLRPAPGRKP